MNTTTPELSDTTTTDELPEEITSLKDYDDLPYPGSAARNSHPSHLAMVARLCGVEPPQPSKCRVLELGCSMGANLFPMAEDLPNSEFVGIDLSKRQIDLGQETLDELKLDNVQLRHMSITDVDESLGKFDYVICHGVYSWVPHEVQKAILDIGHRHLTSNGVAFVSYNTYPGWHLRGVVRDMMRYHVADFPTPQEKVQQARGLLKFLTESAKARSQAYPTLLKEEAETLNDRSDSYIYHEHLEAVNEPLYFHEFVRRVDAAGLRYLADAAVATMVAQLFDESTFEILRGVPLLRREQYMDFLRSRTFRSSLLCHPNIRPNYQMPSSNLLPLHIRLRRPIKGTESENGNVVWDYQIGQLTTGAEFPMTEALRTLQDRYPAWVPVQQLVDEVSEDESRTQLLDALLVSFIRGVVDFAEDPPHILNEVSEKPKCTKLARLQAKRGQKITNRGHQDLIVQPQHRFLIERMDGTRTADDLAELLTAAVADRQFSVSRDEEALAELDENLSRDIVRKELGRLCMLSLLVE